MLQTDADLAIIAGGYNSSNTSHLVEKKKKKLSSFFVNSAEKILSAKEILHADWRTKEEKLTTGYLPENSPVRILVTSGASCPDALVEDVIKKLASFYDAADRLDTKTASFIA